MTALVSVIVTTYKRKGLLIETLRSVAVQEGARIEAIVVDDDGDEEVRVCVKEFDDEVRNGGGSFHYVKRSEHTAARGGQASRNLGARIARGNYLLFLDDDDLLAPSCVAERLKALQFDSELAFSVGQCRIFSDSPRPDDPYWCEWAQSQDDLLMFLSNRVPWQTSGPLWRRAGFDQVGAWDESLGAGWDYEFHIRALASGLRYIRLDTVDYFWRKPRADSYSSFEAFKIQHRRGDHIHAFCAAIRSVERFGCWTDARRSAAWQEALRLLVQCRLNAGDWTLGQSVLNECRAAASVGYRAWAEASLCNMIWIRFGGAIPALSYMKARGLSPP